MHPVVVVMPYLKPGSCAGDVCGVCSGGCIVDGGVAARQRATACLAPPHDGTCGRQGAHAAEPGTQAGNSSIYKTCMLPALVSGSCCRRACITISGRLAPPMAGTSPSTCSRSCAGCSFSRCADPWLCSCGLFARQRSLCQSSWEGDSGDKAQCEQVIILVGTGWSYMKPLLAQREKRILMVVIPLQVCLAVMYLSAACPLLCVSRTAAALIVAALKLVHSHVPVLPSGVNPEQMRLAYKRP